MNKTQYFCSSPKLGIRSRQVNSWKKVYFIKFVPRRHETSLMANVRSKFPTDDFFITALINNASKNIGSNEKP
jgi:hypothetical protein